MKLLDCIENQAGLYTFREASLYANIPISTLRYWFIGAKGRPPVRKAVVDDGGMSYITFQDFIEAVAIRHIRTKFELPLSRIREAVIETMKVYSVEYPFSDSRHGIAIDQKNLHIFLNGIKNPVQLSGKNRRQTSLGSVVDQFMKHLRFDANGKVYEFIAANYGSKVITLNPNIMFGSPRVSQVPYSAITLWRARNTEGNVENVARIYDVETQSVVASCKYCEEELRLAA